MGASDHADLLAEFGARVRTRRHQVGWSLERCAEVAAMHWTYLGSIERGKRNVSLVNIVRLANALGVDPGDLMSGLRIGEAEWESPAS